MSVSLRQDDRTPGGGSEGVRTSRVCVCSCRESQQSGPPLVSIKGEAENIVGFDPAFLDQKTR